MMTPVPSGIVKERVAFEERFELFIVFAAATSKYVECKVCKARRRDCCLSIRE